MNIIEQRPKRTKIVYAPPPTNLYISPSIYSIEINEDQEVEWQWLQLPDGSQVITNYKIIAPQNKAD